jgi:hypothetical protein
VALVIVIGAVVRGPTAIGHERVSR